MVQCAPPTARRFIRRTHSAGVRSAACKPFAITTSKLLNRNSMTTRPIHWKTITSLPRTRTLARVCALSLTSCWPTIRRRIVGQQLVKLSAQTRANVRVLGSEVMVFQWIGLVVIEFLFRSFDVVIANGLHAAERTPAE